mgnify:FL=1
MGKGLYEQYSYCRNISYISVILWGYVLIWYACGNNSVDVKSPRVDSRKYKQRRLSQDLSWDGFHIPKFSLESTERTDLS